jgi:hypothetical protein
MGAMFALLEEQQQVGGGAQPSYPPAAQIAAQ